MKPVIICSCLFGVTKYDRSYNCNKHATTFYKVLNSPVKTSIGKIFGRCKAHRVHYSEQFVVQITREEYVVQEIMQS
jgi:hypothetical protein